MITIRQEQPEDVAAVHALNETAFGQPTESTIVDSVRDTCTDSVSLVAVDYGQVVGHILFSPAVISGENGSVQGMGLAPMAVHPEHQRQGIGTLLARAGIEAMRHRKCPFIRAMS